MADVALVLLAAGASSRMGTPKQLLAVDGIPMLRRAALEALRSCCRPVFAVVGSDAADVAACVAGIDVQVVPNPRWNSGVGSSIHAGVAAAADAGAAAVILALGDQPLLGAGVYDGLVAAWRRTRCPAVASRYSGTVGAPALFERSLFERLLGLPAGDGCKRLLLDLPIGNVALVDCADAAVDVDTPEEYERLRSAGDLPAPSC